MSQVIESARIDRSQTAAGEPIAPWIRQSGSVQMTSRLLAGEPGIV